MTSLNDSAKEILIQLSEVIRQFSESDFTKRTNALNNASVGQHVRHIIEFFTCLQAGYVNNRVNYDLRAHDQSIESDPILSLKLIRDILKFIESSPEDKPIQLETAYHEQENHWITVSTTFKRELAYVIDHAIHHMAMIRMGISSVASEVNLDECFGVAYSTRRHQLVSAEES